MAGYSNIIIEGGNNVVLIGYSSNIGRYINPNTLTRTVITEKFIPFSSGERAPVIYGTYSNYVAQNYNI